MKRINLTGNLVHAPGPLRLVPFAVIAAAVALRTNAVRDVGPTMSTDRWFPVQSRKRQLLVRN